MNVIVMSTGAHRVWRLIVAWIAWALLFPGRFESLFPFRYLTGSRTHDASLGRMNKQ